MLNLALAGASQRESSEDEDEDSGDSDEQTAEQKDRQRKEKALEENVRPAGCCWSDGWQMMRLDASILEAQQNLGQAPNRIMVQRFDNELTALMVCATYGFVILTAAIAQERKTQLQAQIDTLRAETNA